MVAAQKPGYFDFDGFLGQELGAQADGFGERNVASGEAEEVFLEELAELLD